MARREHHIAVFTAFALIHSEHHPLAVDVGGLEVRGFGDAQAGRIGRHQDRSVLEAVDRVEEVHHFLWAENYRQPEGPLGHGYLVDSPGALERHFVQKAQRAHRDTNAAGRQHSRLRQMQLIGSNFFRTEIFRRTMKVFRVGNDLLDIGRLRILGKIADRHVFKHPLA